ncbi:hypothetical protein BJX96DRAFT_151962 [Aspergillus floccosus]
MSYRRSAVNISGLKEQDQSLQREFEDSYVLPDTIMQTQPYLEQEDIDLASTDGESDSVYTETESDREFIAPEDDFPEIADDQTYQPSDPDERISTTSDDDDIIHSTSMRRCGNITVLDERDIMRNGQRETQLLIQCWVKDSVVGHIFGVINSTGKDT